MEKLLVALLLVGCGGSPFEPALFNSSAEDDAGSVASSGGAAGFKDAGFGGSNLGDAGTATETGGAGSGGTTGTGGTVDVETGGASSGGRAPGTGGLRGTGGASTATGGAQGSGGAQDVDSGGCLLVTHDNGLGQTWQDCVPFGTHNQAQAMKACAASGAPNCRLSGCTADIHSMVCGTDASGSFNYGGCWGYADLSAGHVVPAASAGGCPILVGAWQ